MDKTYIYIYNALYRIILYLEKYILHEVIIPKSLFSWATVVMKRHWQQNKNKKFASKMGQIINKISEINGIVVYM